jgi:hypothetical protein
MTPSSPVPLPALSPPAGPRYTPQQWDQIRGAFCSSILADTALSSLAQNLEGRAWPLTGPQELPSAYLELTYVELRESLALRGQPPRVADQLIEILEETLAFDTPFGEMLTQSAEVIHEENPLVKNLAKLKINPDFPVGLTALSADTQSFCQLEKIKTVGELVLAAQRMAGSVIVGGDFRALLNALSNIDEKAVARYLPFRPGATGLHYLEGLAQGVRGQSPALQAALARRVNHPLAAAGLALARTVPKEKVSQAYDALQLHAGALRGFCAADYAELQRLIAAGTPITELVAPVGDAATAAVVAGLLGAPAPATGFWRKLFNRWRTSP